MAESGWSERLRKRLEENLTEVIENMDDEDLQEAIRGAIDMKEIIKELLAEDPKLMASLKKKVRSSLNDIIDDLENFDFGDDKSLDNIVSENLDIEEVIKTLIASDAELRKELEEKVKSVLKEKIENIDESDLPEWEELMELVGIKEIIRRISQDKEIGDFLAAKVDELLRSYLANKLDEDDLPDWRELMEIIGMDQHIRKIAQNSEIQTVVREKVGELIANRLRENLDETELPENFWEEIGTRDQIREILTDRDLKKQVSAHLQDSLKGVMLDIISGKNDALVSFIEKDPSVKNVVSRHISELLRDPKIVSKIQRNLGLKLLGKEDMKTKLMEKISGMFRQQ